MEEPLLTVYELNPPVEMPYHDVNQLPPLFDVSFLDTQAFELLMPETEDDSLRLLVVDDQSEFSLDDDEDDEDEIDIEYVDNVSAPNRRTWTMTLHGDALLPVVSLEGFKFQRGTVRTVMLEFRTDENRTVQVHMTGVVVDHGENDETVSAIIAHAVRHSRRGFENVVFRGDVLVSGVFDDGSLMVFEDIHTKSVAVANRLRNLRPKRN